MTPSSHEKHFAPQKVVFVSSFEKSMPGVCDALSQLHPFGVQEVLLLSSSEKDASDTQRRIASEMQMRLEKADFCVKLCNDLKGFPLEGLLHTLHAEGADFVCVQRSQPLHERYHAFFARDFLFQLLMLSPCPLLLLLETDVPLLAPLFERPAFGIDFSASAKHAFERVASFLERAPEKVSQALIFHVHEQRNIDFLSFMPEEERETLIAQSIQSEMETLEKLASHFGNIGMATEIVTVTGHAEEKLSELVKREKATLLVLGAHGRHNAKGCRIGPVSYALAGSLEIPTLILPQQNIPYPF